MPDIFFPPHYRGRRLLQEARYRQAMRDLEAEAHIDNAFWGQPYISIFEEYPQFAEENGLIYDKITNTMRKK